MAASNASTRREVPRTSCLASGAASVATRPASSSVAGSARSARESNAPSPSRFSRTPYRGPRTAPIAPPPRRHEEMMSSESYHEPLELLSETTRDMHRALTSLIEELEAIDWYQQRADACSDADLKAVLLHNKRE